MKIIGKYTFEVITAVVTKSSILWDTTQALLATCFVLVSCVTYSWTLKMGATCFSDSSLNSTSTRL
jgi:hypothetical protein